MRGKSGHKRECEDIADFLRRELTQLKQIFGQGYELEVIWAPNENSDLSGEVKGTRLYIYEPDREKALQTLVHEFIDYLVSETIRPYKDVTNKLIELLNEYIYQRKERIVEAITRGVLRLATNRGHGLTIGKKVKRR